jgi:anaerobic magnesium-protoporphyrin IX monomethyl ester cyclase
MKVLLVRPFSIVFTKPYFTVKPPLSLGYLAAFLKHNGHEVEILDFAVKKDDSVLAAVLRRFSPSVVGINAYTPNVLDGLELASAVKAIDKKIITVMGGPHSTPLPKETLKSCRDLDFVVIGEGEETLLDFCNMLEKGQRDFSRVAGLCYRHNGGLLRSDPRGLIQNLDDLPFPDRDALLSCRQDSKSFDHNLDMPGRNVLEVITSRGCTDFCTFCTVHRAYMETGRSLRLRTAANVLKEIESCRSKYNIRHVSFLDDTFTINQQRILAIMDGLKKMNLTWNCDARVNLLDKELIFKMVESGCRKMSIGVESGSERILELIHKNITLKQVRDAFRWCHEAHLETIEANFLIGAHPDETPEDLEETRGLIRELKPQRLLASVIVPFPGTEVRNQMIERNLISSNDWRRYILMNEEPPPWRTTYFDSSELMRIQKGMLAEFYFSFGTIIESLKYIRSFSMLKTYLLSAIDVAKGCMTRRALREGKKC